jgi:hypothetical protein
MIVNSLKLRLLLLAATVGVIAYIVAADFYQGG